MSNNQKFLENFKEQKKELRIESVIMDGQWRTLDKWAKQSNVVEEDVEDWIQKNQDYLGYLNLNYRIKDAKTIIDWYAENGFELEEELVPNNFPPRIWLGKTETQWFLDTPRERVAHVRVTCNDPDVNKKIYDLVKYCGGYSRIHDETTITCLYSPYVKSRILRSLNEEETEKVKIQQRGGVWRREMRIFPEEVIIGLYDFYLPFIRHLTKSAQDTMDIFLDQDGQDFQIYEWLIEAASKFDETMGVPFAGYLSKVMRWWPQNLPGQELGDQVADFSRKWSRTRAKYKDEVHSMSTEELAKVTGYEPDEFIVLYEDYYRWLALKNKSSIEYIDSNGDSRTRERYTTRLLQENEVQERNPELLSRLTLAILKATQDTKEYKNGFAMLQYLTNEGSLELKNLVQNEEFVEKLREYLSEEDN